jgi:hypothetical protein
MVQNMNDKETTHDDWQACPPGELTRMVGRLGARERRARFGQLASIGLLSMLLFAAGAILVGGFVIYDEPTFGGISCTDCLSHAGEYHNHLIGTAPMVDVELVGRIETHLEKCDCCREKFRQTYPGVLQDQVAASEMRFRLSLPVFAVVSSPVGY